MGQKYPQNYVADMENIDKKLVSKWIKNKSNIMDVNIPAATKKIHHGRPLKYDDIEEELVEWITHKRSLSTPVSAKILADKTMKDHPKVFDSFNKCPSWIYDLLPRNGLSVRRKSSDQKVYNEQEMGDIHLDYVTHISKLITFHEIHPGRVINMDKTGLYFDVGISKTIHFTGSKSVSIRNTNNINTCTVFLAVTLNGEKLKPLVVFKGQPSSTVAKRMKMEDSAIDSRVMTCYQQKACCDADVMNIWIEKCLKTYCQTDNNNYLHLLMMDNFSPHQTESIRDGVAELG